MKSTDLEYIRQRSTERYDGSIRGVSCADVSALLKERAELLKALEQSLLALEWAMSELGKDRLETLKASEGYKAAREAIRKATNGWDGYRLQIRLEKK